MARKKFSQYVEEGSGVLLQNGNPTLAVNGKTLLRRFSSGSVQVSNPTYVHTGIDLIKLLTSPVPQQQLRAAGDQQGQCGA